MAGPENNTVGSEPQTRAWGVLLAFAAAVALRAWAAAAAGAAAPQEVRYITIARGLAESGEFAGIDRRYPDVIQPPLFPLLLAAALRAPIGEVGAARAVSILMGALLVFPAAAVARRLLGPRSASRAAWLCAVYPLLAHVSSLALTESTFALLVCLAAVLIWRAVDEDAAATRLALAAGLLLGLAFLTRPEGLANAAAAIAAFLAGRLARRAGLARTAVAVALAAAGFAAAALPYAAWVRASTGRWMLAPKAALVEANQALGTAGIAEGWPEEPWSFLFMERVKFGLNQGGTEIRSREVFGHVNVGLAGGIGGAGDGEVALDRAEAGRRNVARNLATLYRDTLKHGYAVPTILLVLGGVGLLSRPWTGHYGRDAVLLAIQVSGCFSFLLSHVEARFLYAAVPLALPWAAEGWRLLEEWAVGTLAPSGRRWAAARAWTVRAGVASVLTLLVLAHLPSAAATTSSLWRPHRELGLWMRQSLGEGRSLMAVAPVAAYYARGRYEVLPYAGLPEALGYARRRGIEYLVVDASEIPRHRPQVTALLDPGGPEPARHGLTLVRQIHAGTSRAICLWRLGPAPGG